MIKGKKSIMNYVLTEAVDAEYRIQGYVRETYAERSVYFSNLGENNVYLKLENTQLTGSFKSRGAFNRLLSLPKDEIDRGIITASTGNHGIAVCYALRELGLEGKIYVPENINQSKLDVLRMYNADIIFRGNDGVVTEAFARKAADKTGAFFISPYNDQKIIGGQGTIGVELMRQIKKIDAVFIPVGGGGLMSGVAGYLKTVEPRIEIIGCQPENSPIMYESVRAGRIIEMESLPTISDGTAGGIEKGSITFNICKNCVDEFVLVSEDEIEDAIKLVLQKSHMLIEGAAALSIASFQKVKEKYRGKNIVLILTGKMISFDDIKRIINK
ncbi:MAG: threonine/serine dehydratase [Acidobacteriota bacterium]